MLTAKSAQISIEKQKHKKAVELLLGMVTGIVADQQLHDMEIKFLQTWLTEFHEVAAVWPGSVIADSIREVMADGIVTADERVHLLKVLQGLATTDFSATGSSSAEVIQLPIKDDVVVEINGKHICLTGEFLYGTRAKCEKLAEFAGGIPVSGVSRKVTYLVVGTNVSPAWAQTSYGRKIQQAVELQAIGHSIAIISEKRWLDVTSS